jgi:signal transduction histidine kinase
LRAIESSLHRLSPARLCLYPGTLMRRCISPGRRGGGSRVLHAGPAELSPGNPPLSFRELQDHYTTELFRYLAQPAQTALRRAHGLGQKALHAGLTVAQMTAIHHESMRTVLLQTLETEPHEPLARPFDAVIRLLRSLPPSESTAAFNAAATFFAHSLSPFETRYREFQQANAALHRRNAKLEEQVKHVATSLYDETLQLVAALHLALDQVLPELPLARLPYFSQVRDFLDQIEGQLTARSNELRPNILDRIGLPAAIECLSSSVAKLEGIKITLDKSMPGPPSASLGAGITLYRAVQEALSNVVRHAHARQVTIRLWQEAGVLTCSIRDNGIGFNASETLCAGSQRGLGLIGIRESLRVLGGTLTINSTPGSGTELLIRLRPNT